MLDIEAIFRYTTWFGAVQDQIVLIFLCVVLISFLFWAGYSAALYQSTTNSTTWKTAEAYESPMWGKNHGHEETSSFSLAHFSSLICPIRSSCLRWTLKFLTLAFTVASYVLVQTIVREVKWIIQPSLILVILLFTLQYIMVSNGTPSWLSSSISSKLSTLLVHTRITASKITTPRKLFWLQILISTFAFASLLIIFYNNEPLVLPVPNRTIPKKMCPPNSPSKPFAETWKEYLKRHDEILARPRKDQRLLVFHAGNEGLGNRMEGLVSAFLLAMVTDRAFLLDWYPSSKCQSWAHDLFERPFMWDWWPIGDGPEEEDQSFYYAYCRACPVRAKIEPVNWEPLLCEPNGGVHDKRVLHIRSTQWFGAALALNNELRPKVCALTGPDMFGTIASYLLKLAPPLQQRLTDFKVENQWKATRGRSGPNTGNQVVSLQIRRLEGFGISEEDTLAFLRCASSVSRDDETKYFLATDHIPTRKMFKEILGDRLLHVNSTFDRSSTTGIQDAILEMYLLGEADEMIMSPYSTYGDVAHARTSIVPYKVGRDGQCLKTLSPQPCFFYYFGLFNLKCWNDNMVVAELTNQENCYL